MARIIESGKRRIIKVSAYDVLSIVREYQRIVPRGADIDDAIDYLNENVICIPEDV